MLRRKLPIFTVLITAVIVYLGVFAYRKYLNPILKNNTSQTKRIGLTTNSSLYLVKKENQGKIYSLEIEMEGNSSEIVHLELGENENRILYDARIKNGTIDFVYTSDWYSDSCYLLVQPSTKNNGQLTISYRFLALN